jgi:hypothetical protein
MTQQKILKILSAIFALREKEYVQREDYDEAHAYANAFDMLAYAASTDWDCLSQFGWANEAEKLIEKVGDDIDFWELEDLIMEDK